MTEIVVAIVAVVGDVVVDSGDDLTLLAVNLLKWQEVVNSKPTLDCKILLILDLLPRIDEQILTMVPGVLVHFDTN